MVETEVKSMAQCDFYSLILYLIGLHTAEAHPSDLILQEQIVKLHKYEANGDIIGVK